MTTTPITPSSIESLSKYLQALTSYSEVTRSTTGQTDAESESQRFTALLTLAARAESLEKMSTLVWRDEEGTFVAPNADARLSKLIIVMQNHPNKDALFAEALTGNLVTPDETDLTIINEINSDFAEKPELPY